MWYLKKSILWTKIDYSRLSSNTYRKNMYVHILEIHVLHFGVVLGEIFFLIFENFSPGYGAIFEFFQGPVGGHLRRSFFQKQNNLYYACSAVNSFSAAPPIKIAPPRKIAPPSSSPRKKSLPKSFLLNVFILVN